MFSLINRKLNMSLIKKMIDNVNNGLDGILRGFNKVENKEPTPIDKRVDYECILPIYRNELDIKHTVMFNRESKDITNIVYPNYKPEDLGLIYQRNTDSLLLKLAIDGKLVNDNEKRLLTIRAFFYELILPWDLILIDRKTIEYINYYQSKCKMEVVKRDELDRFKADKSFYQDSRYLDLFSGVVRFYEDKVKDGKIYPIEFFTHLYAREIGIRIISRDEYYNQEKWICIYLTIYSIIFGVSIPGDYIVIGNDTVTNMFYIENLLNNIQHDNTNNEKVITSHLKLVKG